MSAVPWRPAEGMEPLGAGVTGSYINYQIRSEETEFWSSARADT